MDKASTYQHRLKTLNEAVKSFQNSLSHIYNQNAFEKIHKSLPSNLKIIKKCARIIENGI